MPISRTKKVLLSGLVLTTAAGFAGLGTFATFTDTDSAAQTISTGTVVMDLGTPGVDNRLNVGASQLVAGDSVQRRVKVRNTGTEDLSAITLTTTAATSNLLTSDATNGLHMTIVRCDGALGWAESAVSGGYVYNTCDSVAPGDDLGTRTSIVASRAILGNQINLSAVNTMNALTNTSGTDDLVVTVTLPSTAGNSFQNLSATVTYTFDATQRNATNK